MKKLKLILNCILGLTIGLLIPHNIYGVIIIGGLICAGLLVVVYYFFGK